MTLPYSQINSGQDTSIGDMREMQSIFSQLAECMTEMKKLAESAKEAISALADHNVDSEAHEDIRRKIETGGGGSTSSAVKDMLLQHDISETSHMTLRVKVNTIADQLANIATTINTVVSNHNLSVTAHSDIRAQINAIKSQIGDLNVSNLTEELSNQLKEAITEINQVISQVETSVSQLQAIVQNQNRVIEEVNNKVADTNSKITIIAGNSLAQNTDINDVVLRTEELRLLHDWIDAIEDPTAPYELVHTLDREISPGQTKSFSMNVKLRDSHVDAKFTITPIDSEARFTFSKQDEIANDESLTLTCESDNETGTIFAFRVEAKDGTNNAILRRVIAIAVANPFQSGNIFINGFPAAVEPKKSYKFDIMNLVDSGGNRFTYKFEADSEHVTFTPSEASSATSFTMAVAEEQERDVDVNVTLTIHDNTLESDATIENVTHVNKLPDKSLFRHTVPAYVNPNATVNVTFKGVIAADGTFATYSIIEKPEWMSFTPETYIVANQNVAMKMTDAAPRGEQGTIKVKSLDINDVSFEYEITVNVNRLPVSANIATSLPASSQGGKTITFRISGGTDQDEAGSGITYNIDTGSSGLNFNKVNKITDSTDVQVTLPKVAEDTPKQFSIYAVDSQGERSSDTKNITITITPIWVADPPTITAPRDGNEVPYDGFTVTWSQFTCHADTSN